MVVPARQQRVPLLVAVICALLGASAATETLYAGVENILELDINTFNSSIYNQKRSFFIEFYSSWCGACQAYKPTFIKFADSLKTWAPVTQVSVLNCADDKNMPICREHQIDAYPTLMYFKYNSQNKDDGERYHGDKYNTDRMTLDVAKYVHDDWVKQRPNEWPSFDFIDNSAMLEDLWKSADPTALYVALVVENEPAEIGWATLIGFASDKRIRVAVASPSHPLASKLNAASPNTKLHVFKRNSDTPLASSGDTVTWEEINAKVTDLLEQSSVQQQAPAPIASNQVDGQKPQVPVNFEQYKVQLMDLKSAYGYMLYYEVARKNTIEGDHLASLKGWIHVLKKYAPGTTPIRRLFYRLDEWIQVQMASITSEQWTAKVNEIQDALGHPLPQNATWVACKGSKDYLRGYTCGLWTLMHAVTVEAYKQDGQNSNFKPVVDVLEPIHQFIFNYLSCSECAKNFDHMTEKNHLSAVTRPEDVIMWLWRAHNNVNKRLSGSAGDDPSFRKRQFPPAEICHDCVDAADIYNEANVLSFMQRYYADIRTDEVAAVNEYKMSQFEDGKLEKVAVKHLNPKFAAMADKVDRLEETEQRLQNVDASPQRRWKNLDAKHMGDFERPPSAYGSFFFIWLSIAAIALLVIYAKYRQNRSKFWKTFYYYNDYKLCPWTGPSSNTRKYIA